jgi:hypothetical protein
MKIKVLTSILKYIHPALVVWPVSVWEITNCIIAEDTVN